MGKECYLNITNYQTIRNKHFFFYPQTFNIWIKNEWWWISSTANVDVQREILISSHTSMEISVGSQSCQESSLSVVLKHAYINQTILWLDSVIWRQDAYLRLKVMGDSYVTRFPLFLEIRPCPLRVCAAESNIIPPHTHTPSFPQITKPVKLINHPNSNSSTWYPVWSWRRSRTRLLKTFQFLFQWPLTSKKYVCHYDWEQAHASSVVTNHIYTVIFRNLKNIFLFYFCLLYFRLKIESSFSWKQHQANC